MEKLKLDYNNFISYKQHKFNEDGKTIVFLHGLMSDMYGNKASYIEEFAIKHKINFVAFDNLGHGNSSGKFNECNISSWLDTTLKLIAALDLKNIIIVGSSMGGWLALLIAARNIQNINGFVLIAPAPDFTENILQKLTQEDITTLKTGGEIRLAQSNIPISWQILIDGKQYLLLEEEEIDIHAPVILIHGLQDDSVDPHVSSRLLNIIKAPYLCMKYVKYGDHRLSEPSDIELIVNSIKEIIEN